MSLVIISIITLLYSALLYYCGFGETISGEKLRSHVCGWVEWILVSPRELPL